MRFKNHSRYVLFLFFLIFLSSCLQTSNETNKNTRGSLRQDGLSYYRLGLEEADQGNYLQAIEYIRKSMGQYAKTQSIPYTLFRDGEPIRVSRAEQVRVFPNRELGIIYYYLGLRAKIDGAYSEDNNYFTEAENFLKKSMGEFNTKRAQDYLELTLRDSEFQIVESNKGPRLVGLKYVNFEEKYVPFTFNDALDVSSPKVRIKGEVISQTGISQVTVNGIAIKLDDEKKPSKVKLDAIFQNGLLTQEEFSYQPHASHGSFETDVLLTPGETLLKIEAYDAFYTKNLDSDYKLTLQVKEETKHEDKKDLIPSFSLIVDGSRLLFYGWYSNGTPPNPPIKAKSLTPILNFFDQNDSLIESISLKNVPEEPERYIKALHINDIKEVYKEIQVQMGVESNEISRTISIFRYRQDHTDKIIIPLETPSRNRIQIINEPSLGKLHWNRITEKSSLEFIPNPNAQGTDIILLSQSHRNEKIELIIVDLKASTQKDIQETDIQPSPSRKDKTKESLKMTETMSIDITVSGYSDHDLEMGIYSYKPSLDLLFNCSGVDNGQTITIYHNGNEILSYSHAVNLQRLQQIPLFCNFTNLMDVNHIVVKVGEFGQGKLRSDEKILKQFYIFHKSERNILPPVHRMYTELKIDPNSELSTIGERLSRELSRQVKQIFNNTDSRLNLITSEVRNRLDRQEGNKKAYNPLYNTRVGNLYPVQWLLECIIDRREEKDHYVVGFYLNDVSRIRGKTIINFDISFLMDPIQKELPQPKVDQALHIEIRNVFRYASEVLERTLVTGQIPFENNYEVSGPGNRNLKIEVDKKTGLRPGMRLFFFKSDKDLSEPLFFDEGYYEGWIKTTDKKIVVELNNSALSKEFKKAKYAFIR